MWSSCALFSTAMTYGNPSCQTVVIKWITTLSKWGKGVLFHSEASQICAPLACHTILPNEELCDKLKEYLLTLLPHISFYNVWVPRLAHNGPSVDAKSLEEFIFIFVFVFVLTAGLRHYLFSWLEPWCEFHKLAFNPYCTVACSVGERWWWIHTVSALQSSLQADSQIPLDLCIVLSTNYHWKTSPYFFHVSPTVKLLLAN